MAPPATAQSVPCMARESLIRMLEQNYGETQVGLGLQNATALIEVWNSEKSGTFTIFVTHSQGISCVILTGNNWLMTVQEEADPAS